MQPKVVTVLVLAGYRLAVAFDDGTDGVVDFTALIHEGERGLFSSLRDQRRFAEVRINPEWGHLEWPNGADIDPYLLHERARTSATA